MLLAIEKSLKHTPTDRRYMPMNKKFKMKLHRTTITLIFLTSALALFAFFGTHINPKEKEAALVQAILYSLDNFHYAPKDIDDHFSEEFYTFYLQRLDGAKRWLTQEDIRKLEPFVDQLDEEVQNGSYEFFNLSIGLLKSGLEKTQSYYREALAKPFDFTLKESYELEGDKREYAKNDEELRDQWRRAMKYETLVRLADKLDSQAEGKDSTLLGKTFEELEADARQDVLKLYDDWYTRLQRRKRSDYLDIYLNALANLFDPHTGYFEPIEKENFDISMSGRLEGIGARLQTDGDYTKIVSIVVGGPAWKEGELEENDLILKVAQGDEEPVDIRAMSIDDVVQLIRGPKGTEVRLTVKKVDGTIKTISIIRDVVIFEEGFAKSLILTTPSGSKAGYILLPRFYADFNRANGRSCAKDVAEEIRKLKADHVESIILDLRNNGGGSLRDVVDMSGLFIEEGPIVQVKARDRKPQYLTDDEPDVLWDGALIVMVNEFSASASEILAAAMQDYKRAIIVGSKNTFGKGTVQRFFDLDRLLSGNEDIKPLGEIKLTIQKFYRINGGSTQLRGVNSDIILPDQYAFMDVGEKSYDYALEWTKIAPAYYSPQNVWDAGKVLPTVKALSVERLKNDSTFQAITDYAAKLKVRSDLSLINLNLDKYREDQKSWTETSEKFDALFEREVVTDIQNTSTDARLIQNDEVKKERNEKWIKNVRKDIYLAEALRILDDVKKAEQQ